MENKHEDLTWLERQYRQALSESDIDNIRLTGATYFCALRNGTATIEDVDEIQNELFHANCRQIQA